MQCDIALTVNRQQPRPTRGAVLFHIAMLQVTFQRPGSKEGSRGAGIGLGTSALRGRETDGQPLVAVGDERRDRFQGVGRHGEP
ncbi:hypothetical protein GCM10023237_06670 [Streptomyces coeruleoprunus]